MTDSRWKNLALEVIGCFVSALGLYSFAVAAGVPVTGVAGIGAILFRLFGLPIGVTNIIMNIPIVLICFKYLGKDFFFRSVRCMVLFAIFTDYVLAALPVYQGDRMLATICGGVIGGVGDALIYIGYLWRGKRKKRTGTDDSSAARCDRRTAFHCKSGGGIGTGYGTFLSGRGRNCDLSAWWRATSNAV